MVTIVATIINRHYVLIQSKQKSNGDQMFFLDPMPLAGRGGYPRDYLFSSEWFLGHQSEKIVFHLETVLSESHLRQRMCVPVGSTQQP